MPENGTEIYSHRRVFSLSELGRSIENMFQKNYNKHYWFTAEISKLNYYPQSGHCYPLLVEKKEGRTKAEFRAMIYKDIYQAINKKFMAIAQTALADGMNILFKAKVGYHSLHGLSLTILDVEPAFTLGEMARERTQTIEKLKAGGLYGRNKQLSLPLVLQKIAVISVKTSKGYRDFVQTLQNHPAGRSISCTLFPALLQGDKAVGSISEALGSIEAAGEQFDAVALIRGGGGETGLNCYDSYQLTSTIATFPLPVCTGIGHATNETVAELISWTNMITPTALAHFFINHNLDFVKRVQVARDKLVTKTTQVLRESNTQLENYNRLCISIGRLKLKEAHRNLKFLHQSLGAAATDCIKMEKRNRLRQISTSLKTAADKITFQNGHVIKTIGKTINVQSRQCFAGRQRLLEEMLKSIKRNSSDQLARTATDIPFLTQRYSSAIKTNLLHQNRNLSAAETKVRLLDPQNVLRRGFSITLHNNTVIQSAEQLNDQDEITTIFADGEVKSRIIKPNDYE